jgi:hypothetical protein
MEVVEIPGEVRISRPQAVVLMDPVSGQPVSGSSQPMAEIIDTTTSATYYYHCEAAPGTITTDAAWRISRFTVATGVLQWADGNGKFDNAASTRATTQVYA